MLFFCCSDLHLAAAFCVLKGIDMNKENMLKWAEVLESGEYKQIHGGWGSDIQGAYCCLNVACKVFTGHDVDSAGGITETFDRIFGEGFMDNAGKFYQMNDNIQMSFPEIAVKVRELAETGSLTLEP